MVNSIRILFIVVGMIGYGCSNDAEVLPNPNDLLSEKEILLCRSWAYVSVQVSDREYTHADPNMELGTDRAQLGGNRADLIRRYIVYHTNGTYQLKWAERGDYQLGTIDTENWQPNFGYWQLDGDMLIHNPGLFYETEYSIDVTEKTFSRTSSRYMNEAFQGAVWSVGETVTQTELFQIKE